MTDGERPSLATVAKAKVLTRMLSSESQNENKDADEQTLKAELDGLIEKIKKAQAEAADKTIEDICSD
ncbi:hypothetical protein X975_04023, partial [Stegodyphus mimosarum]